MSRLILVGLADHTNTKGLVYVSARTLAAELDISPNTVFIGYRLFEREGILQRTGKRVGPGGTIEYQMVVEHLAPKNSRFIPLSESMNSSAKAIRQRSTQCTESKHLTDEPTDRSSDLGTITDTDTPSDTPSDAAIRERSRSGGRSRSENLNSNQNNGSRAADVEVLFDDALNLELEYRPSNVPRHVLKSRKRAVYTKAAEEVLNSYPQAHPSVQADRDLALMVCEMVNPDNPNLRVGATTKRAVRDRYRGDPVEYLSQQFCGDGDSDFGF